MKSMNPNRIAELRLSKRWNQRELADALGVHYMTISKLERGEMRLTQHWMEQLGKALGVTPAEILADYAIVRSIYVNGSIGDTFDLAKANDIAGGEGLDPIKFEVDLGTQPPNTSMYFFVSTDLYSPSMRAGDIARFTAFNSLGSDPSYFLGRVCILEIERPPTFLIGILERGANPQIYDLRLPVGGYQRGIKPDRVHVLSLVIGLPDVIVDDEGVPI